MKKSAGFRNNLPIFVNAGCAFYKDLQPGLFPLNFSCETLTMKHIFTVLIVTIIASACIRGTVPTPPAEPENPKPEVLAGAPVINMLGAESTQVLHPDFPEQSFQFTLSNANDNTAVTISESRGVDASISRYPTMCYLKVKANPQFDNDAYLVVRASNGEDCDEFKMEFEKAYLSMLPNEGTLVKEGTKSIFPCGMRAVNEVRIDFDANVNLRAEHEGDWLTVTTEKGKNSISISVQTNNTIEPREATISVSDAMFGVLTTSLTVRQEKGDDEFTLERNALIALWKALDGEHWTYEEGYSSVEGLAAKTTNWCVHPDLNAWRGIETYKSYDGADLEGHVAEVRISTLCPKGELPEELGDLKYCRKLDFGYLSQNREEENRHITGKLPKSIGEMKYLNTLNLYDQCIEEDLETSSLRELVEKKHIRRIDIENNNFTGGCPEWLGDVLENAKYFIKGNRLSGQVPAKVRNHPFWQSPCLKQNGPHDGKWLYYGEWQMQQQEGYGLWE